MTLLRMKSDLHSRERQLRKSDRTEIWILMDDEHIIIKLRMQNKRHRLSKKDGYRLIYIVYKEIEEVGLLDIYPKNGPKQQLDIDDVEVVRLVQQFKCEREKGELSPYKI